MKRNFVLLLAIWIAVFSLSTLEAEEKTQPPPLPPGIGGRPGDFGVPVGLPEDRTMEESTSVIGISGPENAMLPPSPMRKGAGELELAPVSRTTEETGKTEVLLILEGEIKELRENKKTEENEVIIITEKKTTFSITVSPKTEIILEDETPGNMHSLKNAGFIEAHCDIAPEKGGFIARLIKIIKSKP